MKFVHTKSKAPYTLKNNVSRFSIFTCVISVLKCVVILLLIEHPKKPVICNIWGSTANKTLAKLSSFFLLLQPIGLEFRSFNESN